MGDTSSNGYFSIIMFVFRGCKLPTAHSKKCHWKSVNWKMKNLLGTPGLFCSVLAAYTPENWHVPRKGAMSKGKWSSKHHLRGYVGFRGSKLWELKGTWFCQVPLSLVLAISMPYPLFKVNIDRKLHFISDPKRIRKMIVHKLLARMCFF